VVAAGQCATAGEQLGFVLREKVDRGFRPEDDSGSGSRLSSLPRQQIVACRLGGYAKL
jgi:hypothetical protein